MMQQLYLHFIFVYFYVHLTWNYRLNAIIIYF